MPLIPLLMAGKGWATVAGMVLILVGNIAPLVGMPDDVGRGLEDAGMALGGFGLVRKGVAGK